MKKQITLRLLDIAYKNRINQTELADLFDVNKTYISQLKSGNKTISLTHVLTFLQRFPETDANYLLTGKTTGNINTQTGGTRNIQAGNNISGSNETEIKYLKELLIEKQNQIDFLKGLLEK